MWEFSPAVALFGGAAVALFDRLAVALLDGPALLGDVAMLDGAAVALFDGSASLGDFAVGMLELGLLRGPFADDSPLSYSIISIETYTSGIWRT